MPKLTVIDQKKKEKQVYNLAQNSIIFGRKDDSDIPLRAKGVSRAHAEVRKERGQFFLVDRKSGNGTFLGNLKLEPKKNYPLNENDVFKIEHFEITFHAELDPERKFKEDKTDSEIIEIKMVKKVLQALDQEQCPSIEVLNSKSKAAKLAIDDSTAEFFVGREQECDLFIDDGTVSRQHAKIVKKWGSIVLIDLASKNCTFVNHEKIDEKPLKDGDKVMFGTVKCLYRNPKDVDLDALSQEISKKKREALKQEAENLESSSLENSPPENTPIEEEILVSHQKSDEQENSQTNKKESESEQDSKQNIGASSEKELPATQTKSPENKAAQTSAAASDSKNKNPFYSNTDKMILIVGSLIGIFGLAILLMLMMR